jgi:hypothetical protein
MCNLAITMDCFTKSNNFKLEKYITEFNKIILTY